jgi:TetR/AcrR family transcriptional regulator, cholesterol catabolism regulator
VSADASSDPLGDRTRIIDAGAGRSLDDSAVNSRPRRTPEAQARIVLDTVIELLESGGYDSVQVREVARRARISLVTLYSLYPSRDELIVSAVEAWLKDNVFNEVVSLPPDPSMSEALILMMSTAFEPWEQHPRMLEALFRARESPGSQRLELRGYAFAEGVLDPIFKDADPDFLADLFMILRHVAYSAMARCARGEIPIADLLPIMERTVYRLTSDEQATKRIPRSWVPLQRRKQRNANKR